MTTARAGLRPGADPLDVISGQRFQDQGDPLIWDFEGRDHWGIFHSPDDSPDEWLAACRRTDEHMRAAAGLLPGDRVLEVCSGNGWAANRLSAAGYDVTAVDPSPGNVAAARSDASASGLTTRFHEGSATALPVPDGQFDLVYSQAALHRIADRPAALREIRRVLRPGGRVLIDDLVTPAAHTALSPESVNWVYNRLQSAPAWSAPEYRDQMSAAGLQVSSAADLSEHLRRTYEVLGLLSARVDSLDPRLQHAFALMVRAIDHREVGWSVFVARAGNPA